MLKLVCFAAVVACALGQHQLYPGDPGYQPGYQAPQQYQGASQQYQGAPQQYQGASQYQGAPQYLAQGQAAPITATNYQADGHQRSESRDNEGNVKGQYSYVDPNGKTITVKYTAGKDGFQVEGDHLPRSPVPQNPVPGPQSQGQYNQYQQSQSRAPHQFPQQQYQQQQYQPQQYQQQQYQQPQQYQQQQQTLANFPQTPQHRFGGGPGNSGVPGVSVNVDPAGGGGYNYQFNYQ